MPFVKLLVKNSPLPLWLVILLIAAFFLRVPTFFEPLWYGDEAITLTLGEGIRQGLLLYRDIHDNKPPLLYLIAAVAGNLFWLKVILAFWAFASTIIFWKLASLLFPKRENLIKVATIIFTFFITLPLIEGNLANGEIFMLLTTLFAFLIVITKCQAPLIKGKTIRSVILAGSIMGMGALFKAPSLIDILAPLILWFGLTLAKSKNQTGLTMGTFIVHSVVFVFFSLLPLIVTSLFWAIQGAFQFYLKSALLDNFGYLASWRTGSFSLGSTFSQNGPLLIRTGLLILITIIALYLFKKKKITTGFLFTTIWFLASLFSVTLSERPYPHYLIQVSPSLSILVAIAITYRTKMQFFPYPLFLLLAIPLILFKFYYYPVFSYYQNFVSFALGNLSRDEYFDSFDTRTSRNYKVARFILESTKPNGKIFVWGNDSEIYALTHMLPPVRFITLYHINDFSGRQEVSKNLETYPPRYIVTTASTSTFPELELILGKKYTLVRQEGDASVYLKMNNLNLLRR